MELTSHESFRNRFFHFHQRMETYRIFYGAGNEQAAHDALFIFKGSIDLDAENVPVPKWLFKAMTNLISEYVPQPQIGKKAVNNRKNKAVTERNAALLRYQAVMGLCESSENLSEAYQKASNKLLGTPYFGSVEVIERDFKKVQVALKSKTEIMKYYPLKGSLFESQD